MSQTGIVPPRPDVAGSVSETVIGPDQMHWVARHLAFAAGELAHDATRSAAEAGRYARLEALFRDLAERPDPDAPGVLVEAGQGRRARLVDLFWDAWKRNQVDPFIRHIDRDLVEAAKELLAGLAWRLPECE